jgi:hypothetical protein
LEESEINESIIDLNQRKLIRKEVLELSMGKPDK